MPQAAIQFALADPAISCVIPGIRNEKQVLSNIVAGTMEAMPKELVQKLYKHHWIRGNWFA